MNAVEWAELRERLARAVVSVNGLKNRAAATDNESEYMRLVGKSEGLRVALSYMDEAHPRALSGGECSFCSGNGCEYGCGRCEKAHVGARSHKVCRVCHGSGRAPVEASAS